MAKIPEHIIEILTRLGKLEGRIEALEENYLETSKYVPTARPAAKKSSTKPEAPVAELNKQPKTKTVEVKCICKEMRGGGVTHWDCPVCGPKNRGFEIIRGSEGF